MVSAGSRCSIVAFGACAVRWSTWYMQYSWFASFGMRCGRDGVTLGAVHVLHAFF